MYLIKFAYDGTKFQGFSMERGRKTVEGEIVSVLKNFNIADKIYASSRTDRNVSALGNVLGIKTGENIKKIFGILNSNLPEMLFYSYATVGDNFKPRHARERWYRYFILSSNLDIENMKEKANRIVGEHDFSGFSKKDGRNSVRKINEIKIARENEFFIIDIRGESFLWNMVRRIIGFIAYGEGDPFETGSRFIVPAENLVLMDVSYDFDFTPVRVRKKFYRRYQEMRTMFFIYGRMYNISEGRWGIEPQ